METAAGGGGGGGGRGGRRGSSSSTREEEKKPKVVERGFKVTSRPSSPNSLFRRGPHPAGGAGSGLRPEGESSSSSARSSLALNRMERAGGSVASSATREVTNISTPSTANSITSHPSPSLTPRLPISNPVSRSNSLLASPGAAALQRPRIPSRSNSINRSWTPPTKSAPPPPSTPSSVPTTPHLTTSFAPLPPQPSLPLLPLGQVSSEPHELEDDAAPSPHFFSLDQASSRISPTLSNSSRSQENSTSSSSNDSSGTSNSLGASAGFPLHAGTDQETEPTDDGEELGTSCEGGERMSEVLDGWEERRWSVNSDVVGGGGAEGKVRC
ncbi:hypothetical protein BDY24DRAFT_378290 [Mrakia frigida]|uniref:uncharacterized protein n=1 Tax=Mrakia frigida TaxID=29902 RepID=UPI003FCC082C